MAPTSGAGAPKKKPARKSTLAVGAARASGERAKRRSTPLIAADPARPAETAPATPAQAAPTPATPAAVTSTAATLAPAASSGKHRPRPVAKSVPTRKAVARSGARTTKPSRAAAAGPRRDEGGATSASPRHTPAPKVRALKAVTDDVVVPEPAIGAGSSGGSRSIAPGVEELLTAGIAAVRVAAEAAGISPDDVERHLASMLSFVRRRVTGDYTVDEFGFDEDFTRHFYLPVLRPLYRSWFRVEVRGIENIPSEGGGLVVANHSGTVAMDSLMTQVAVHDEHPEHRHLRMLGADLVFQTPVIGQVARKSGSTLAANPDAERLLSSGELCGVWPEGFKGVGKPFSERYKLQRFGRGGFVSAALRTGAPIIPCSIVGAEEIYPIIGNAKAVARLLGAPYAPITPTWPLLGPLGLIPLPSKWIIEFGSPVETADLGPNAADDPMLVFDLTDQVRETIQQTLYSLLMQRRSVFF
ncbi:1-acyl-sn-glycerol-3-phosphate acyltransferase [Pedococcus dokdonensis]|uniref:1-acyl-sn-glycerol-3-phosphate acyltransferase n=1 Tax=Pedococcus dokdonensis TaxID=443156 RepID=A0A1H0UXI1_9MICO|nr:lysophospholipid acyltransferase family protein [Pedococcus dokdonensis]SDP70999.1 1-acyl-sn-glycerol-3-phosphate acyltransferase [Pedococcus dokdonensis]